MQAELITAPGDGLAPALLLTLGSRLKAQYLFNVPEGFSRFVLEHKLRPGLGLRGVFATDLLCATGLPGLVMRLRGEGHGAVELFGPPGTFTFAASLRHFVHWKHPTVLVSECSGSEVGSGVYDDEHISVVPLHRSQCQHGGKGPAAWKPPLWMWSTSNERKAADDDDQDEGKQSQTELGAERLCGDQDLSKHIEARTEPQNSAKSDEESSTSSSSGSGNGTSCSSGSDEEESEGSGGAGPSGSGRSCPPGLPTAWALHAAQAARQPDGTWQAHGRQYTWVEGVEVPLLRRQGTVTGTVGPDNKSRAAGRVPKNESLLGFLCRIKASDTLLAVLSIKSQDDVERACEHPAVAALAKQDASRMAATVLFISPCVASSTALISLCDVLPGPKYMLEHPGPGGTDTLGFLSSVRTTARLNLISKRVFPLPLALKTQGQRGQSATAEARRSHDERMDAHTVQYVRETSRLTWPSAGGPPTLEVSSAGASASGSSTFLPTRTAVDVASLQDEVLAAHPNLKDGIKDLLGTSPQLAVHGPPETAAVQAWKPPPPPDQPPLATPLGGTNKRAAEDLKARLKRPRPPPPPSEPHPGSNNVPNVQNQSSVAVGTLATQQPPVQQDDYPQVTFLGTGSAEPSKYRGASAILLRVAPRGAALLDCGEGAWGQLVRLHGVEGAGALVAGLGCLWVSHRHADHMAGVLQILMQYPRTAPPLLVIGPRSLQHWLSEAAPVLSAPAYTFVHCSELHNGSHWAHAALHGSLGIASTACVSMRHCSDAFGVVMRHQSGWSIVYSGDTQPCDNLVRAGQGATLLIHEATFEPALVGEARKKRHSTTTEAMDVARRMGAYRTVLTHFSQRYPKCPEGVLEECQRGGSSFAVAFDGMCVPLSLLEHLPKVTLLAAMALEQTSNQAEDAGRT